MKITFKKQDRQRGLAGIGQGARGYRINLDGERLGSITHTAREGVTWGYIPTSTDPFYVCISRSGSIPYLNTFCAPQRLFDNLAEAKQFAKDYIKKHLEGK